jgi:hypothetical protein
MDNKKFETLIDLIINENEEQARALFHDIVVEKSREIYESMMDEENAMAGPAADVLDEIGADVAAEEQGMAEGEDEDDLDLGDDDEVIDIDAEEFGDDEGEEDLEGRVVDLEDKLDQLMAEFEEIMGGDEEAAGEEEMDDAEQDFDDAEETDEEAMMEAIALKKVPVTHGDNGAYTTSPGLKNSGQAGMDSKPVKFSGASESVPTSPKAPSNAYTKGESSVKGAGSFKNAPAQNNFSEKGESTPKPVTKDAAGGVRSPVAESRNTAKKRI